MKLNVFNKVYGNFRVLAVLLLSITSGTVNAGIKVQLVTEELPPFQYIGQDGKVEGFAYEVVTDVLTASNMDWSINVLDWSMAYQTATKHANSCIFSLAKNELRENKFLWVGHFFESETVMFSLKHRNLSLENFSAAKNYNVAAMREGLPYQYMVKHGFKESENLYVVSTFEALVKLLTRRQGSIDFIASNTAFFKNNLPSGYTMDDFEQHPVIPDLSHKLYLACNKNFPPKLFTKLQTQMTAYKQSEKFKSLQLAWRDKL